MSMETFKQFSERKSKGTRRASAQTYFDWVFNAKSFDEIIEIVQKCMKNTGRSAYDVFGLFKLIPNFETSPLKGLIFQACLMNTSAASEDVYKHGHQLFDAYISYKATRQGSKEAGLNLDV